ncbi:MAG: hypothetical protein ACXW18_03520 [Pyrinomonadaceae bacterium]
MIQATRLSKVLFALLPGALPVLLTSPKFDLTLAPGLLFAPPPFVALLVGKAPVTVAVVARPASFIVVAPVVIVPPSVQFPAPLFVLPIVRSSSLFPLPPLLVALTALRLIL